MNKKILVIWSVDENKYHLKSINHKNQFTIFANTFYN
jgi:hypothetical protein